MSAKNNRPSSHTGAVKDPAGGPIKTNSTVYPARIHLSEAAESYLEQLATDLMLGRVELHQLPSCLLQFWSFGHQTGRESLRPELDQAVWDARRYYLRAFNDNGKALRAFTDAQIDQLAAVWNAAMDEAAGVSA